MILSSTYYAGYAEQGVLWDMTDAYASSDLKQDRMHTAAQELSMV